MIDKLRGKIISSSSRNIIFRVGPVDLVFTGNPSDFITNEDCEILFYFHWSAENGPSLFGFKNDETRATFKSLISCPKIGPSLAIQILSQISPEILFGLIKNGDEKALSKINGIGPKSAKNLISFLQDKNFDFLNQNTSSENYQLNKNIFDLREALMSLGYSNSDISKIVIEISKDSSLISFDQMLRRALFLLQK